MSNCDLPPDDKAVILLAVSACWNGILVTLAVNDVERTLAKEARSRAADALAKIMLTGGKRT